MKHPSKNDWKKNSHWSTERYIWMHGVSHYSALMLKQSAAAALPSVVNYSEDSHLSLRLCSLLKESRETRNKPTLQHSVFTVHQTIIWVWSGNEWKSSEKQTEDVDDWRWIILVALFVLNVYFINRLFLLLISKTVIRFVPYLPSPERLYCRCLKCTARPVVHSHWLNSVMRGEPTEPHMASVLGMVWPLVAKECSDWFQHFLFHFTFHFHLKNITCTNRYILDPHTHKKT